MFSARILLSCESLSVVDKLDAAVLAKQNEPLPAPASLRKVVGYWELDDLKPDLDLIQSGRSYTKGKELFSIAGCMECHSMQGEGQTVGPDLTAIREKYTAVGLLERLLDPSLEVAEEYQAYIVETEDAWYYGPFVSQDEDFVRMRANARDSNDVVAIQRSDIEFLTNPIERPYRA